jgi:hypothetical protein
MKHLLSGVALGAVLAIAVPVWAQAPSTPPGAAAPPSASSTAPPSSAASSTQAPAASEKAVTAPSKTASGWVQPRPRRQAHRVRRYARYGYRPYYGYYGWGSPSDHMARELNAQQLGGYGYGWGYSPYARSRYVPYD